MEDALEQDGKTERANKSRRMPIDRSVLRRRRKVEIHGKESRTRSDAKHVDGCRGDGRETSRQGKWAEHGGPPQAIGWFAVLQVGV